MKVGGGAAEEALARRQGIPIFPLPNGVLFPRAPLGLHVFEPRYRRMTEDVLASDSLMAVALLKPGWERDYYGTPPVHPVACAGVVEEHRRLPDGRFNIRLRGLRRIEILGFLGEAAYRVAAFRCLDDREASASPGRDDERERLLWRCVRLAQQVGGGYASLSGLPAERPFEAGVNRLCQGLSIEADQRQRLLEIDDVLERCRVLHGLLAECWKESAARGDAPEPVH